MEGPGARLYARVQRKERAGECGRLPLRPRAAQEVQGPIPRSIPDHESLQQVLHVRKLESKCICCINHCGSGCNVHFQILMICNNIRN